MSFVLTKEQLEQIKDYLLLYYGKKDTQLTRANLPLSGQELLAVVQDGQNKVVDVNDVLKVKYPFVPDEEDLTSVSSGSADLLKFKDNDYTPLAYSGMGRKILRKNMMNGVNILTQEMMPIDTEEGPNDPGKNTIYIIQYDFDLDGMTIKIPSNSILKFNGGSLCNGTLIGNNTKIIASKVTIFENVIIEGTWSVPEITSSWFGDAASNNVLKQAFNLTNDNMHNTVTVEAGTYQVSCLEDRTAPINVGSNTNVNLIGKVKLLSNSFYYGWVFNIVYGAKNINIYGGGTIEGDKFEHDYETGALTLGTKILSTDASNTPKGIVLYTDNEQIVGTLEPSQSLSENVYWVRNAFNDTLDPSGETGYVTTNYTFYKIVNGKWKAVNTCESCHGINIHECYNVTISNITIEKCAGDCIYIGYRNTPANEIKFINLTLDNGRRQGISITSAENVLIDNCRISNINGTSPQSGIDIEPNADSFITNLVIRNTIITRINGGGIEVMNAKINGLDNILIENILIDGCKYGIGNRKLDVNGLTIRNVTIKNNNTYGIILKPYEEDLPEPYNIRNSSVENVIVDERHDGNKYAKTNIITGINISVNNCTFNGNTLVRSYLYTDEDHSRGINVSNCTFYAPDGFVQIHNACTVTGGTIICSNLRMPNGYVSIRDAKIIVDDISATEDKNSGSRFNSIEKCHLECSNNLFFSQNCMLLNSYIVAGLITTGKCTIIKSNIITFKERKTQDRAENIRVGEYCEISNNDIRVSNKEVISRGYPIRLAQYDIFKNNVYSITQATDEEERPITTQVAAFLNVPVDSAEISFNRFIISGVSSFVWRLIYFTSSKKSNVVLFNNKFEYSPNLVEGTFNITNYSAYYASDKNRFGKSNERPILTNIEVTFEYFDTDLGQPIYWNGWYWVDATGGRKTWPVTYTLSNITSSNMNQPSVGESYLTTLSVNTGYELPPTITIAIGNTTLVAGVDYTYNTITGEVEVLGIGGVGGVTNELTITATAVQ